MGETMDELDKHNFSMFSVIELMRRELSSNEYKCPGGHRLDNKLGTREDYIEEVVDELVPGAVGDVWEAKYAEVELDADENWVYDNRCDKLITIELEYEGSISYPVASGDCVQSLSMAEDFEYANRLWYVAFERWRLKKILSDAMRGMV